MSERQALIEWEQRSGRSYDYLAPESGWRAALARFFGFWHVCLVRASDCGEADDHRGA